VKALTLWQPWASLVAAGAKRIETRSWATSCRGPLLIHAGLRWDPELRDLSLREPFRTALFGDLCAWPGDLPLGAVVAVASLDDCRPTAEEWACDLSKLELAAGDYRPGRWGWFLEDVRPLPAPVPWPGAQGLWTAPEELISLVGKGVDRG
jgi:hypothetical protein